jgi:methionyl-tRNA formyltransferase
MKLAFLGSPEPAAFALRALADAGHEVVLVVTQADKRRGRGAAPSPTAAKAAAVELGIPVTHVVSDVTEVGAELGVVVAYGRIIKPDVLARLPMINIHFSLLPRWRGAAPVERAILAGDSDTGVCIMAVEEGLDTGGVFRREVVAIDPDESAAQLTARLSRLGADLLVATLAAGLGEPEIQVGEATYAAKIEPAELHLDWARAAVELHRVVRLGRAWTTWHGRRLLVLQSQVADGAVTGSPGALHGTMVATGSGALRLVRVQPEGRPPMDAEAWAHGVRPSREELLGA